MKSTLTLLTFLLVSCLMFAQEGTVRGTVLDAKTGEPIIYGNVILQGTSLGASTDLDGFYNIAGVPPGEYTVQADYFGYDSTTTVVTVRAEAVSVANLTLNTSEGVKLNTVQVNARRQEAQNEVTISKVTVTPKQIQSLPSTGGQADLAQYMTVLPGVISTGDQGGQLYIRGGSPVQNKILLDGMTIYNPFHSIGFFSVFETDIIRSVDVLTGGFGAEYGGRVSAIVDITTREGNRTDFGGSVAVNPFQGKVLLEGPLKPYDGPGTGSISYILTAKRSLLQETSPVLYSYAVNEELFGEGTEGETVDGLPFTFTDVYGKISFVTGNNTKFNVFGFNFTDGVDYPGVADLNWTNGGGGIDFSLIPSNSNTIIGGTAAFSDYNIALEEADGNPRTSGISNFGFKLNFTNFTRNGEINYGMQFQAINTDFEFQNFLGTTVSQRNSNTELNGFLAVRQNFGSLIIEPSLRLQYYASQSQFRPEPRLGVKLKAAERLRFKFAGGLYSQNILSSVNEQDVVNLFVGFLTGPERLQDFEGNRLDNRLQTAVHAIGGVEIDLGERVELNVEPYYKGFTQLIALNRNKLRGSDPDFTVETGDARGIDFSIRYNGGDLYAYATYSLGKVTRDDGEQVFPTVFDRRHNSNVLINYTFGAEDDWEAGFRWNVGSGFPFTQTRGFYGENVFADGLETDVLGENANLGILFAAERNGGRLPAYHRLDLSLKRTFEFSEDSNLEAVATVTNAYNRENIFFFDRVRFERVNQLPVLPSLGLNFRW